MLDTLITSKTRMKLLLKFFSNPDIRAYLRGLADELGENTNAIRIELNKLTEAGLLRSRHEGNMVWYNANTANPFYEVLNRLVLKYMGLETLVENILNKLGPIDLAFISGDYAVGIDSGTIHLTIVGSELDEKYLEELKEKAEKITKRRIKLLILSSEAFNKDYTNYKNGKNIILLQHLDS